VAEHFTRNVQFFGGVAKLQIPNPKSYTQVPEPRTPNFEN